MSRLFGTDGVRGVANRDLTAELALALGSAAARRLCSTSGAGRCVAVVGRDPRASGEMLEAAVIAGITSEGVDVLRVGVLPTPAVAYLTASYDADLGVMISASHNPMPDNGIKFFARGGFKLEDSIEDEIEALLEKPWQRPMGAAVGEVWYDDDLAEKSYVDHLVESCGTDLSGLRIAVDCANGAASVFGPEALRRSGADVVVINASPDGRNINDNCGSTHPEQLQAATVASRADFGVAFDGDADRCLAVDGSGSLIDGDKIMGALARSMRSEGKLHEDTLVVTVMSNLGLVKAMEAEGISIVQSPVGDRYVLEAMRAGGFSLGGEQSGHVIASEYATTGDGVLTSMLIARMVKLSGKSLATLVADIPRLPQTLVNVSGVDRNGLDHPEVVETVSYVERLLGDTGRVLMRPSGTEPLVRVMVEAPTQLQADGIAELLGHAVKKHLSLDQK